MTTTNHLHQHLIDSINDITTDIFNAFIIQFANETLAYHIGAPNLKLVHTVDDAITVVEQLTSKAFIDDSRARIQGDTKELITATTHQLVNDSNTVDNISHDDDRSIDRVLSNTSLNEDDFFGQPIPDHMLSDSLDTTHDWTTEFDPAPSDTVSEPTPSLIDDDVLRSDMVTNMATFKADLDRFTTLLDTFKDLVDQSQDYLSTTSATTSASPNTVSLILPNVPTAVSSWLTNHKRNKTPLCQLLDPSFKISSKAVKVWRDSVSDKTLIIAYLYGCTPYPDNDKTKYVVKLPSGERLCRSNDTNRKFCFVFQKGINPVQFTKAELLASPYRWLLDTNYLTKVN